MTFFRLFLLFSLLLIPSLATAHAPIKGIGNFYNGVVHPLLVPPHLLLLVAIGLLLGQQTRDRIHKGIGLFAATIAVSLTFTGLGLRLPVEDTLLIFTAAIAVIVAASPSLHLFAILAAAFIAAAFIGFDSAVENFSGTNLWLSLGGTAVGAVIALFYISTLSLRLEKPWQKIGVRVVGSWIGAASLLVLALNFLTQNPK